MNILHFSDLHGNAKIIFKAKQKCEQEGFKPDLIILSGDTAPTHVKYMSLLPSGFRVIDKEAEAKHQVKWIINELNPRLQLFDCPKVGVNGNHDFFNFETKDSDKIGYMVLNKGGQNWTINGVKIGLAVGVKPLILEWHEELYEDEFDKILDKLDRDIDILVTHAPCSGILDEAYGGDKIGYNCLAKKIVGQIGNEPYFNKLKGHFFGHAHDSYGWNLVELDGRKIIFSNASCGVNKIQISNL